MHDERNCIMECGRVAPEDLRPNSGWRFVDTDADERFVCPHCLVDYWTMQGECIRCGRDWLMDPDPAKRLLGWKDIGSLRRPGGRDWVGSCVLICPNCLTERERRLFPPAR
jgi:hypothetical protein